MKHYAAERQGHGDAILEACHDDTGVLVEQLRRIGYQSATADERRQYQPDRLQIRYLVFKPAAAQTRRFPAA